MKRSEELRAQAAQKLQEARRIKDEAEKNGGMNGEKREQVERILADMDAILEDAKTEERMEAAASTVAPEERGRRLPEVVEEEEDEPEEEREARALSQTPEYREAFYRYVRGGEDHLTMEQRSMLYEARALVEGTDSAGGYLAPEQLVVAVEREAQDLEQLAPRMDVLNTNARLIKFNREEEAIQFGWVAELGTKPEDQPVLGRVQLEPHVGAGVVWVSDELLEDTQFALEPYLGVLAGEAKVELEETAFLSGTGGTQPFGILTRINGEAGTPQRYTTQAPAAQGHLNGDDFVRALYDLPRRHRRNASWVLGSQAIVSVMLLKDNNGQYIWRPGLQEGQPASVLGKPVIESPELALDNPVTSGNDIGIVGDLRRYTVMRRLQMQVKRLEELRALTDEVGFRFRFRTGGDVRRLDAFRSIRVGAAA